MPNLELFGDAGFPFTSFADLSQTVVVLPLSPSLSEIGLYLNLLSRFGAETGYPALRVTVERPGSTLSSGRDYLVVGTTFDQPAFNSLSPLLPATLDDAGVHVQPPARGLPADLNYLQTESSHWLSHVLGRAEIENLISDDSEPADALIEEAQSLSSNRSIVAIMLRKDSSADVLSEVLTDPSPTFQLKSSLTLLRHSTFTAYAAGVMPYHVGHISWYAAMRMYLTRYFVLLLILVMALILLCARYVYDWMAWHAHQRLKLADNSRD
jgi:cellulose synthase (UDP-forming)